MSRTNGSVRLKCLVQFDPSEISKLAVLNEGKRVEKSLALFRSEIPMVAVNPAAPGFQNADRSAYLQFLVEASGRRISLKEASAVADTADQAHLLFAEVQQGLSTANASGSDGDGISFAAKVRAGRAAAFAAHPGPIKIQGMDIENVVNAQNKLSAGDLKNLSVYVDHLKSGMEIAQDVKGSVSFSGSWGQMKTNYISEYVSWIYKAMQK